MAAKLHQCRDCRRLSVYIFQYENCPTGAEAKHRKRNSTSCSTPYKKRQLREYLTVRE
jgi:hypothetical protein